MLDDWRMVGSRIRYMGNKHDLAPKVAELVRRRRADKPFLDLFCGMCSVAGAVADSGRRVLGNDVQGYAALVARCLLAAPGPPPAPESLARALRRGFLRNRARLLERFAEDVERERAIIAAADIAGYRDAYAGWRHAANDAGIAAEMQGIREGNVGVLPYRLASLCFAWGYFGLEQAIAIDSVRYAIDQARRSGVLSGADADWALVALLQATSCASASPGHFAQYLHPSSDRGFVRILRQRRRDIWAQFVTEAGLLAPYGSQLGRDSNRVFCSDAIDVWGQLDEQGFRDGIVYADPPYSKDHYSRFYHVLETLHVYDHPRVNGRGRYRDERFATPFSRKTTVRSAFDDLSAAVAERDCTFILSYPTRGLLNGECKTDPGDVLREHFSSVTLRMQVRTRHSTLGARHGIASNEVHELLWVAV
jgi:adenine-specific DNA-methyltransferase